MSESGQFQGYARLSSESKQDPTQEIKWVLPSHFSSKSLSGLFKIDWISKNDLPFSLVGHLTNPWNDNKPVKIGFDGQVIKISSFNFKFKFRKIFKGY